MTIDWLRQAVRKLSGGYGKHALGADGKCHTKVPDPDHDPRHRREGDR